jgi:hypothetical protein
VVSRRREVGDTSARSLLTTVLGEYVLPRGRPVWTSALVETLALFGVEEKSARQALARTAKGAGWLASERVGRRTRWALTPPGRRLLTEGAQRIYDFGSGEPRLGRHLAGGAGFGARGQAGPAAPGAHPAQLGRLRLPGARRVDHAP